jgi:hypothetical protein
MSQLEILAQHRDALLLAEAIGWLHDYRKCSDEQLKVQAKNPQGSALPRSEATDPNSLAGRYNALTSVNLQLPVPSNARTVTNLLDDNTWKTDLLGQYLSRCHNTAHFDKQDPAGGKQSYPGIQISSPFGFERAVPPDLTNRMWGLPWASLEAYTLAQRQNLLAALRKLFPQVGADTRRPTNEVDLWSWGLLVGALYKTALAGVLISGNNLPACDLRWRLLSVRVDGLGYLFNVVRLPDLLSRQQLLQNALDQVRSLLEETYPLANEVYRDENGSLYVVADLPNLLSLTNSQGVPLSQLILQEFAKATLKHNQALQLGGELVPVLALERKPWWGQDPNRHGSDELPAINAMLSSDVRSQADVKAIEDFWNSRVDVICTVCGLRPQGPGKKAIERNVCDICEQRRLDRSQAWASKQSHETIWIDEVADTTDHLTAARTGQRKHETIWIDEVADTNGRLALIVGQFDLKGWLEGNLLDSLLVIAPNEGTTTTKTASFSRVQRIWQATRQFWQDTRAELAQLLLDDRRRVLLYLDQAPDLGPFHVYELDLGAVTLSVVWYPQQADGQGGYLISADNLNAVARRLGAERRIYEDAASAAIWLEDYLQQEFMQGNRTLILRNPESTTGKRQQNVLTGRRLIRTEHQDRAYSTAIPILAEPRSFMALVPADRSLDILQQIKLKYEREMGKVRNRLPLHLGAVYFSRRTPLRTALDAGQAMIKRQSIPKIWQMTATQQGALPSAKSQLAAGTHQFQHTITLTLQEGGNTIDWHVPAVMGDGTTPDNWYPYVFFQQDSNGNSQPTGRQRAFNDTHGKWLVHAGDLQVGDLVTFVPSTFDFEFLDTTARRFEIHYGADGRRASRRTRPFYLEDLDRLETLWGYLKQLQPAQRYQVVSTIEATREAWHGTDSNGQSLTDPVFRQFVADTLAGAEWRGDAWQSQDARDRLIQAGVRGELADVLELRMKILKES